MKLRIRVLALSPKRWQEIYVLHKTGVLRRIETKKTNSIEYWVVKPSKLPAWLRKFAD